MSAALAGLFKNLGLEEAAKSAIGGAIGDAVGNAAAGGGGKGDGTTPPQPGDSGIKGDAISGMLLGSVAGMASMKFGGVMQTLKSLKTATDPKTAIGLPATIGEGVVGFSKAARGYSGKPEEAILDGAQSFSKALEKPTMGLSKFGTVAIDIVRESREWSKMLSEGNKKFSQYNGQIAAATGLSQAAQIRRDMEFAQKTSGTAQSQIAAEDRMQDQLQPINVLSRNLENTVGSFVTRVEAALFDVTMTNKALAAVNERLFGQAKKGETMPVLDMHSRLAGQYRDEQREKRQNKL